MNFRNGDDNYAAALLYDELATRFGADRVFRSTNSLRPGEDFTVVLLEKLRRCRVVLVVIGPRWLGSTDSAGRRRLWQRNDWVRREIMLALREDKHVIPVLLHDLPRLEPGQLPPSIRPLAKRQSVKLDHRSLRAGLTALVRDLSELDELAPPRPSRTSRLPVRLWGAVDRPALLARVDDAMADGAVVVLHGRAGVGKTQLAAEYAHRHAHEHHTTWWVSGERPELITEQVGELARAAGLDPRSGIDHLCRELNRRGRWLLVLDGVDDVHALGDVLAGCPDRVLVTSRDHRWAPPAVVVDTPGLTRSESVRLLTERLDHLPEAQASELAEALDDLPLAVAQAATFLRGSTIGVRRYLELLGTRVGPLLDRGGSPTYPRTLGEVWSLALESLESTDPAGAELARLCAFFAATPIPVDLFDAAATALATPLREIATDPIRLDDAAAAVARSGLVDVRTGHLRPHHLFQSYVRDRMTAEQSARTRDAARQVLVARHPGDPRSAESWGRYAVLLPHVLALDLVRGADPRCHRLVLDASHYLVVLGDAKTARDLVSAALAHWTAEFGERHPTVLAATSQLAGAHFRLGDYDSARELDERVLAHRRQALGPDHPDTLAAEHDLAAVAWALSRQDSRHRHEEVLRRRREILGGDHPDTLRTAHNLAVHLRTVRSVREALALDLDTRARFARVLGEDHVDTLRSTHALAVDLRLLGSAAEARAWNEDTLARCRRVLGEDHIETLRCANNLVQDLRALGAHAEADRLEQDNNARLRHLPG